MNSDANPPLRFAVPSKGRMREQSEAVLVQLGLELSASPDDRGYRRAVRDNDEVEVWMMSAPDIAAALAQGTVDIGITGRDLLEEGKDELVSAQQQVSVARSLNFAHTSLVVAVPQSWIDVETMSDLSSMAYDFRHRTGRRLRVATKFVSCTRRFFFSHGVSDYRIAYSQGATEGAPLTGLAELVVDLTSTGDTLRANMLRPLHDGMVLRSSAVVAVCPPALRNRRRDGVMSSILSRLPAAEELEH